MSGWHWGRRLLALLLLLLVTGLWQCQAVDQVLYEGWYGGRAAGPGGPAGPCCWCRYCAAVSDMHRAASGCGTGADGDASGPSTTSSGGWVWELGRVVRGVHTVQVL
jgi:hypothetical protein